MNEFREEMTLATDEHISKMLDSLYEPYHSGKVEDAQNINTTLLTALVFAPKAIAKKLFRHFSEKSEKRCWEDMLKILDATKEGKITRRDCQYAQQVVLHHLELQAYPNLRFDYDQ